MHKSKMVTAHSFTGTDSGRSEIEYEGQNQVHQKSIVGLKVGWRLKRQKRKEAV